MWYGITIYKAFSGLKTVRDNSNAFENSSKGVLDEGEEKGR